MVLDAPPHHVWPALTDAKAFGTWFGAEFDGSFTPGAHVTGRIVPTQVDAEVAKAQEPYKGMPIDITVDRIDPMRLFPSAGTRSQSIAPWTIRRNPRRWFSSSSRRWATARDSRSPSRASTTRSSFCHPCSAPIAEMPGNGAGSGN